MTAPSVLPEGWMGKRSRKWLRRAARRRKRIIEIGSWLGRSTKVLADSTKGRVWAVDHWLGTPNDAEQHQLYAADVARGSVFDQFCANLAPELGSGKVVALRMPSADAAKVLVSQYGSVFDMVFIDGDHSYEGCAADIRNYLPLLKRGGLLCGHDYHWPGVKRAVDEAIGEELVTLGPKSLWSVTV